MSPVIGAQSFPDIDTSSLAAGGAIGIPQWESIGFRA